jgi:hypothetical protein
VLQRARFKLLYIGLIVLLPVMAVAQGLSDDPNRLFIVTHSDLFYDRQATTKNGILNAIDRLGSSVPTVLLTEFTDPKMHFLVPNIQYLVPSESGEFAFTTTAQKIYLAGGFMGACLDRSKEYILKQWDHALNPTLEIHYVTDGIFGPENFITFLPDTVRNTYRLALTADDAINRMILKDFIIFLEGQPQADAVWEQTIRNWILDYEKKDYSQTKALQKDLTIEIQRNGKKIFMERDAGSQSKGTLILNFVSSDQIPSN